MEEKPKFHNIQRRRMLRRKEVLITKYAIGFMGFSMLLAGIRTHCYMTSVQDV